MRFDHALEKRNINACYYYYYLQPSCESLSYVVSLTRK